MQARIIALSLLVAGCGQQANGPAADPAAPPAITTARVPAAMETTVPDNPAVDADDPVLWADPADPSRALLIGTDKSRGLYVHDLQGRMLQFFPDGPMNNVDLRPGFRVNGREMVLVSAADRGRFGVMHWLLDPATLRLERYGFVPLGKAHGEPYGYCMGYWGGEFLAIPNNKSGAVEVHAITAGPDGPVLSPRAQWKLASQTEGCVFDDRTGDLYVGEEDAAIWRMSLANPAAAPVSVATADGQRLVADIEGLTILRDGPASYLIASSQGDSAFAVHRMDAGALEFLGRFRVGGGAIDPVTQTDGVDAFSGPIAGYPEGAIAMHDHCDGDGPDDPPASVCDSDDKQQNYKLVGWREVKAALGLQ